MQNYCFKKNFIFLIWFAQPDRKNEGYSVYTS